MSEEKINENPAENAEEINENQEEINENQSDEQNEEVDTSDGSDKEEADKDEEAPTEPSNDEEEDDSADDLSDDEPSKPEVDVDFATDPGLENTVIVGVDRGTYNLFFVSPDNESFLNDMRNTGRVFGEITVTCSTRNDKTDEVIIAVKK